MRKRGRKGVALLVVLWITAALTLIMYAFLGEMQVEYSLSGSYGDEKKAEQLAWSAVDLACITVDNAVQPWHGPNDLWATNPDRFYEIALGDGAFSVLHPTYADDGKLQWGLEDEASKVNLNYAPKEILMKLPRMTEEIADSIIDWRDQDSNPGPSGAETGYYQGLSPAYACKNAPFETVEELLFVRGVTPEILYGRDLNLNGRIDPAEKDGGSTPDPGLYGLVTVWSSDKNQTLDGQAKINVNGDLNAVTDAQLLQYGLTRGDLQVVLACQLFYAGPVRSLAHLLTHQDAGRQFSGFPKERFKLVVDKFAMMDGDAVPGLVNINTAPQQVLRCLPGITEEIALKIIGARTVSGADLSNMGWLTDVVAPGELQQFANFITFHSYQYRIHAVGRIGIAYAMTTSAETDPQERPGAMRRMIAVYDRLATPRPRLVYWKDATKLGMPYDPSEGPEQSTK